MDVAPGSCFVVAVSYPAGTYFTVDVNAKFHGGKIALPMASTLEDVLNEQEILNDPATATCNAGSPAFCDRGGVGPAWFFDETKQTLFLRIVDPVHYMERPGFETYEREAQWSAGIAARLTKINYLTEYIVTASCAELVGHSNLCAAAPGQQLPAASLRSGDACTRVDHASILPPHLDLQSTANLGEWRAKAYPLFSLPSLPALASFAASSGTVLQLPSQAAFDACDLSGASAVLHTFSSATPFLLLDLPSAGMYWFAANDVAKCL